LRASFCYIDPDYSIEISPYAQAAFQLATVIVRLPVIADKTRRNATILAPGPLHIWIAGEALSSSFLSRLGSLFKVLPSSVLSVHAATFTHQTTQSTGRSRLRSNSW
jgi:hypothetical protein